MYRTPVLFALLLAAAASLACDADVLRLNYHRTPAAKPAAKPATALPRATDALHRNAAPRASLTASTKLGPR